MSARYGLLPAMAGLVLLSACTVLGPGKPPRYIGYHGPEGTHFYPDSNPPVEWDGKSGKNILWQTPMPCVSYGGILAVKDRVFVMSEFGYKSDFPEIVCVDAKSGAHTQLVQLLHAFHDRRRSDLRAKLLHASLHRREMKARRPQSYI